MKIKEALEEAKCNLNKNEIEDSGIIARELLSYTLQKDKQYLVININEELEEIQYNQFITKIKEVIKGKPLQYINHNQEFMGINFYVDENVLIPQPDTEILVENVLDISSKIEGKIKILDLCTGSGAIAISLKDRLKDAQIFASDISDKALKVAEKNSKLNQLEVNFTKSDLFENIEEKDFDIIVSNPPYIKTEIIKTLSKQVRREPILALDGGEDGLNIYKRIIVDAYKYIKNNGYLCLEIGYDQKEEVIKLLKQYKNYTEITAIKDLSNNDRCVIAKIQK